MTIERFFWEGWGWCFWREKEETDEMTEKNEPFEAQHQKEHRLDEMPVPPKTLKSAPPPHTPHIHPRLSGFELGRMLSVTFQKWERRRGTVHLSETLVFSLCGETYPAEHITISACDNIGNSVYPLYLSA